MLGIAAIERARKKQASRIGWLRAGDANTKLFHAKMRARRRKNFIHSLRVGNREFFDHAEKEEAVYEHFAAGIGQRDRREKSFNSDALNIPQIDDQGLLSPFSIAEVWERSLPPPQ